MAVKYCRTKPYIPAEDKNWILEKYSEILDTGALIQGKYVAEFEKKVSDYVGTKHAIAVNSCGTGLEIALRASGITGKKFIVPTQTFVASVSCIIRSGNIPIITDIDKETQCLSLEIIKENLDADVAGIVLVHMAGLITPEMLRIRQFCEDNGLFLLTDDAHAFGAHIIDSISKTKYCAGNLGNAGVFSFYPSKIITTGEGGMITTNDDGLASRLRVMRTHGMIQNAQPIKGIDFGGICEVASSNYRMTEFSAVLGLSQINHTDNWVDRRNDIASLYHDNLSGVDWLALPPSYENIRQSRWKYIVRLDDKIDRMKYLKRLLDKGIQTGSSYWPPCSHQKIFQPYVSKLGCPNADSVLRKHFSLPMYIELKDEEVIEICDVVKAAI